MFVFLGYCRRDGSADIKGTQRYVKVLDTSDEIVEVCNMREIADLKDMGYKVLFLNYPIVCMPQWINSYSVFLYKKDNNYVFGFSQHAYSPMCVNSVQEFLDDNYSNNTYTISYEDLKVIVKYRDFKVRYICNWGRNIYKYLIPDFMYPILSKLKVLQGTSFLVADESKNERTFNNLLFENFDADKPFVSLVSIYFYNEKIFEQVYGLLMEKMKLLGKEYVLLTEDARGNMLYDWNKSTHSDILLSGEVSSSHGWYKELLLCYRRDAFNKYLAQYDKWMTGYDLLKL